MEDWDIPDPQDDFENQFADELEMLDEMGEGINDHKVVKYGNPRSRKSLKFPTPDVASLEETIGSNGVSQAVKRQLDDMYALLSDNDGSDEEIDDNRDSQAKRARMSTSPEGITRENNPARSSSSQPINQETVSSSPPQTTITRVSKAKVFTRPLIGKHCISLTGCDRGRRVYLSLNKDDTLEANKACGKQTLYTKRPTHLLGVPFSVLKETIYEERRIKFLEESKRITESLNDALQDNGMNDESDEESVFGVNEKGLWVDKYSPKAYVELLSDDGINRNLLSWLKLWDCVVFGNEQPKKKKTDEKENKDKRNNYIREEDTAWMELDPTGRPINKVALLCGPPGLGKTTLAHIVAQHAGYSVVEMNASDDRSVDVFRNKIESATQMQSVLNSGKSPNCLIIDEIDGAPTPAINVLLSLIKKKDTDFSNQPKKKKRKKAEMLSRPIICICNDQYVPALRLLRQQAFVISFPPTLSGRLAQRLMQVSRNELLKTDMTTLLALCEKAENDIRSCLNTLQFLRQKRQNLTLDFIQSATIGQKDSQKSLFFLWQSIFQLPRPKKKRFALLSKTPVPEANILPGLGLGNTAHPPEITSSAARFYNMLHLASSNGQYNKLENGIFENYLNMKFKDAHLNLVVKATEWLEFTDFISKNLLQQQHFVLMRYQPFLSVAFHMFFAGPSQQKLSYPSTQYENVLKETKMQNIMSSMLNEISPHLRGNLDAQTLAVELLPLLLHIITPTLRPINTQLFSPSEKQQLADLINTMISYNLMYHQERNSEGLYNYSLDPKIEDVVKFPGLPQQKQLTYATKQLIAREVQLEKMRRMEKALLRKNVSSNSSKEIKSKTNDQNKGKVSQEKASNPMVLNYKRKEVKPMVEKKEKDFFGQPIIAKPTEDSNNLCQGNIQTAKLPFWFKFQAGFSNAVRRTIKIQDLL